MLYPVYPSRFDLDAGIVLWWSAPRPRRRKPGSWSGRQSEKFMKRLRHKFDAPSFSGEDKKKDQVWEWLTGVA